MNKEQAQQAAEEPLYATAYNEDSDRIGKQHIYYEGQYYALCGYHLGNDGDAELIDENNICKRCKNKLNEKASN